MNEIKDNTMDLIRLVCRGRKMLREEGLIPFASKSGSYLTNRARYLNRYAKVIARYKINQVKYKAPPKPYNILYVPPKKIVKVSNNCPWREGLMVNNGRIEGGEWDKKNVQPITQLEKYRAIKDHFCEGKSWEETRIIDHLNRKLQNESRKTIDGCKNKEELYNRYSTSINNLYYEIRTNGYLLEKNRTEDFLKYPSGYDLIQLHIGRDGDFIFRYGGGQHRLSISKILDLDAIPVNICVRHKQWQEIRDQVYTAESKDELSQSVREKLSHPDLRGIVDKKENW